MEPAVSRSLEARVWLTNNPGALAVNRFHTAADARAFVDALYREGATEVLVEHPRVDRSGAPRADGLLVRVPAIGETRWAVERFCRREGPGGVPPGGFVMRAVGREITLWWD